MSEFDVKVVEYPQKRLAGQRVRTSMQKAQQDCPALWQSFGPGIGGIAGAKLAQGSFGLCVMLNEADFDYWAAVEIDASASLPDGLESIEVPAGLYATTTVPNLEKLGPAYMFLYEDWPKSQREYGFSGQALSFELYPPNWQLAAAFEIFMPVKKN